MSPTPEHPRDLLEQRARLLARPVAPPAADTIDLVTFALARETYAVEARFVTEVFGLADLSVLPGAEPPVFGVTAWRGDLLTVLDLRPVLGLSAAALDDLGRVIVVGRGGPAFGVLVDQVHGLVAVPASTLREPPEGVALRRDYLLGVTREAVVVLAAEKLLALHT